MDTEEKVINILRRISFHDLLDEINYGYEWIHSEEHLQFQIKPFLWEIDDFRKEILKTPSSAYYYWRDVLGTKKPWKEAEEIIFTDPEYSYFYVIDVYPYGNTSAEKCIRKSPIYWYHYKNYYGIK